MLDLSSLFRAFSSLKNTSLLQILLCSRLLYIKEGRRGKDGLGRLMMLLSFHDSLCIIRRKLLFLVYDLCIHSGQRLSESSMRGDIQLRFGGRLLFC
ncbi:hypothetical protein MPTK1_Vg00420 [Marchantia polymorpha subsp. ruderalis]|uniref:Uncharacterized protein n=1 Tax=Marchantia polymorpha TaxID=3197 RepID=A0A2R6VWQ1_MARPO|nr:hypothetical protein MARPO_YB0011 [Marchantia polymorpha]BBN20526.1 hypothetical protein Mp_Vg00420 [Marchantia polymorpha subsp. ruderalis]|eukprot:PTQ26032.1 hypothetical protein MARPO_YB0011 [Marchantia polymorpha]